MSSPPKEKFDGKKFLRGLNPFDLIGWVKAFVVTFRVAIIIGLVFLGVFGFGFIKGRYNAPVAVDVEDSIIYVRSKDTGEEHRIEFKNKEMFFDGEKVNVRDVPSLRPYGIELKPKAVIGVTTTGRVAGGAALEVAHFFNFNLDVLALYQFLGVGVSYDINYKGIVRISNSSIGIGVGKDFSNRDNGAVAAIIYWSTAF